MKAPVIAEYDGTRDLVSRICKALEHNEDNHCLVNWEYLAPLDQLHVGGAAATAELAAKLGVQPNIRVLDVGCGLGGSARHLAALYDCFVTGVDLNEPFVQLAQLLSQRTGQSDRVSFVRGSATLLPFADQVFDMVWTQHVVMNIPEANEFYAEIYRVLLPGAQLAMYDVIAGEGGPALFPVPWAHDADRSFLRTADSLRQIIESCGFQILSWLDVTELGIRWAEERALVLQNRSDLKGCAFPGGEFPRMAANLDQNLRERRIRLLQAVVRRPDRCRPN